MIMTFTYRDTRGGGLDFFRHDNRGDIWVVSYVGRVVGFINRIHVIDNLIIGFPKMEIRRSKQVSIFPSMDLSCLSRFANSA